MISDKHPDMLKEVDFDPQERWMTPVVNKLAMGGKSSDAPELCIIRDDTIRSGGNTPGIRINNSIKLKVAEKLEKMGVREAEVGYPGYPDHIEFIKLLKKENFKLQVGAHTRYYDPAYRTEIAKTIDSGADLVNLVGYWGYIMTHALCPQNWNGSIEDRIGDAVSYAKSLGARKIAVGADYHRMELVARVVQTAVQAGADRIVVYDARGWFVPETMAYLVRFVRALAPDIEIGVHCHDDMGLATINTIEAIRAGAVACDVTVNSTGHRCGNAAFEQVVPALESLYGIKTGIDLGQLTELSKLIIKEYGVQIAQNHPITGPLMYSYGGSHLGGILRGHWYFWENIRAETVGNARHVVFSPIALRRGRTGGIAVKVETMGLDADNAAKLDQVIEKLEPLMAAKNEMTEPEVEAVIRSVYT